MTVSRAPATFVRPRRYHMGEHMGTSLATHDVRQVTWQVLAPDRRQRSDRQTGAASNGMQERLGVSLSARQVRQANRSENAPNNGPGASDL